MDIRQVQLYTNTERHAQAIGECIFIFMFAGMRRMELRMPDGYRTDLDCAQGSMVFVATPGMTLDFDYRTPRETWAVWVSPEAVGRCSEPGFIELLDGGITVPIQRAQTIARGFISGWREKLEDMAECLANPHPRTALRARCCFMAILRDLLGHGDEQPRTPAQRFKSIMDADAGCERTLDALARECGYCRDYLRDCFVREFGVAPGEYRSRKRLARAMELLARTDLSMKEIAAQTGFRHMSHLSMLFRKRFGETPREAMRRLRLRL